MYDSPMGVRESRIVQSIGSPIVSDTPLPDKPSCFGSTTNYENPARYPGKAIQVIFG